VTMVCSWREQRHQAGMAEELSLRLAGTDNVPKLRRIVDALIAKGMEGDVSAFNEIADRVDGKVPEQGSKCRAMLKRRSSSTASSA